MLVVFFGMIPMLGFLFSLDAMIYWHRFDAVEAARYLRLSSSGRYLFVDFPQPPGRRG